MKNKDLAHALREIANRLDGLDPEQSMYSAKLYTHGMRSREKLVEALSIRDDSPVNQESSEGVTWAAFEAARVPVSVFFDPKIVGKTKQVETVKVVETVTDGNVNDLLAADQS